jgi:hypothetical protein
LIIFFLIFTSSWSSSLSNDVDMFSFAGFWPDISVNLMALCMICEKQMLIAAVDPSC